MMKAIPFLPLFAVLLVSSLPLGAAFSLSRWYTPTIPVLTSNGVYNINFEIRVEVESSDTLPVALLNLTITTNSGAAVGVLDNFWSISGNREGVGPVVSFAGETMQQLVRIFDASNVAQQTPLLENYDDYAIIFVSLHVDPQAVGLRKGELPSHLYVDAYFTDLSSSSFDFPVLSPDDAVVVGSPLKGTRWVATNGAQNIFSAHRRAITPVTPNVMMQRYAIDWLKFDDDHHLYTGDGESNEDWENWGLPLYAPLAGVVVSKRDDLGDHDPFTLSYDIDGDNVIGNNVIVNVGDLGESGQTLYTVMAHMKQYSVVVEVGDQVEQGQLLGYLGNSGNSGAPHLHMHLSTCSAGITCVDYPYVFEKYQLVQELHFHPADLPGGHSQGDAQIKPIFEEALPYNFQVVNFDNFSDDEDCVTVFCDCDNQGSAATTLTASLFVITITAMLGIAAGDHL